MEFQSVYLVTFAVFSALLIVSALEDVREYRIPNWVIVVLVVMYPVHYFILSDQISLLSSLLIAAVFFLIGTGLFSAGVMGGGDVKLISVSALWVGLNGLVPFLFGMAVVGGLMSVFMMSPPMRHTAAQLCVRVGFMSAQEKVLNDRIPYGVAICAGGLFSVYSLICASL